MRIVLLITTALLTSFGFFAQLSSPIFENLDGLSWDKPTNTLVKTAATSWNSGTAFSSNIWTQVDDWSIEYVTENVDETKAFGLAASDAIGGGLASLDYAFYVSRGNLYITQAGRVVSKLGKTKSGVTLSISTAGARVIFSMNGKTFKVLTRSANDFYVGAIVYGQGDQLIGLITDVPPPPPDDPVLVIPENDIYTELLTMPNAFVKDVDDSFCFYFKTRKIGVDEMLNYSIYNKNHFDRSALVPELGVPVKLGVNKLCLDVSELSEGVYTFELITEEGDVLYTKFKVLGSPSGEDDSDPSNPN